MESSDLSAAALLYIGYSPLAFRNVGSFVIQVPYGRHRELPKYANLTTSLVETPLVITSLGKKSVTQKHMAQKIHNYL